MKTSIGNIIQQVQTSEVHVYVGVGITVTATQGSRTLTAKSGSDGWAILKLSSYGNWTIKASVGGHVKTQTLNIDTVRTYYTSLAKLEDVSWSNINLISNSGMAPMAFKTGDTKKVIINGAETSVMIIGFNHDTITASGKKAGITFQLKDCLPQPYPMTTSGNSMDIWTNCSMRTATLPSILKTMPSDLRNVIKPVTKYTNNGAAGSKVLISTTDTLFILSLSEVFDVSGYWGLSRIEEGKQYAYFQSGNSKVKKRAGVSSDWYLRSPHRVNSTDQYIYFTKVNTLGNATFDTASMSNGLSFAFCV